MKKNYSAPQIRVRDVYHNIICLSPGKGAGAKGRGFGMQQMSEPSDGFANEKIWDEEE